MVHEKSMHLLKDRGVVVQDGKVLDLFKKHGFAVGGKKVFPTEKQVMAAISTVPSTITIEARRSVNNITIGGRDVAFLPGHGASSMITSAGDKRNATMEDYDTFCKLIHTSSLLDVNGWMMVMPMDMHRATVHLDMLLSNMLLCDKPLFGNPLSAQTTLDGIEMVSRLWGGRETIINKPVSVALLHQTTPLQLSSDMLRSLTLLVSHGQPCIIGSRPVTDCSDSNDVYELLALQNAEVITGIALSQLMKEGAPAIYGVLTVPGGTEREMLLSGVSEVPKLMQYTAQLAGFYDLPGGAECGCTEAHFPDAQAGAESALALYAAARSGINLVMQACGLLGSGQAMSFEKFLIDEEVCNIIRQLLDYGENPEDSMPTLMKGTEYTNWMRSGKMHIHERADDQLTRRLAKYEKPDIDPAIEQDLTEYVNRRKNS